MCTFLFLELKTAYTIALATTKLVLILKMTNLIQMLRFQQCLCADIRSRSDQQSFERWRHFSVNAKDSCKNYNLPMVILAIDQLSIRKVDSFSNWTLELCINDSANLWNDSIFAENNWRSGMVICFSAWLIKKSVERTVEHFTQYTIWTNATIIRHY